MLCIKNSCVYIDYLGQRNKIGFDFLRYAYACQVNRVHAPTLHTYQHHFTTHTLSTIYIFPLYSEIKISENDRTIRYNYKKGSSDTSTQDLVIKANYFPYF